MGASRLLLAASLAATFGVPVSALCAPGVSHIPLSASETPVHPGVKTGHAVSPGPQYNGGAGEMAVPYRDGARSRGSENGRGDTTDSSDHGIRQQDRITVHSAVLDTLGSVRDDGSSDVDAQGLGLAVRPLNSTERQAFDVSAGGLVVTGVTPGLGMRAGFRLGDVVLMVDGVDISSPDQFYKLAQQAPHDRPLPVLVRRPGSNLFLPLSAPAHR